MKYNKQWLKDNEGKVLHSKKGECTVKYENGKYMFKVDEGDTWIESNCMDENLNNGIWRLFDPIRKCYIKD